MSALDWLRGACILHGGPIYTIDGIRFEMHPHFGPAVVSKRDGRVLESQPGPRHRFWRAVTLWAQQGRRVTAEGACIYEVPREPQTVCLVGRHYVEVPEGRDPPLDILGPGEHQLLVDASGGRGVSPAEWTRPNTTRAVGFAGGLGPDNLAGELPRIAAVARGPWWVDMETKLRTDDWFDIALAERCSDAFEQFLATARIGT